MKHTSTKEIRKDSTRNLVHRMDCLNGSMEILKPGSRTSLVAAAIEAELSSRGAGYTYNSCVGSSQPMTPQAKRELARG